MTTARTAKKKQENKKATSFSFAEAKRRIEASDTGFTVTFTERPGQALDVPESITFAGPHSKEAARGRAIAARRYAALGVEKGSDEAAAQFGVEYELALLSQCARAWTFTAEDGTPVPVTPENAKVIFLAEPTWTQQASAEFWKRFVDPFSDGNA